MFSLAAMKGARAAQKVAEAAVPDEAEAAAESASESSDGDGMSSAEDSDDERRFALYDCSLTLGARELSAPLLGSRLPYDEYRPHGAWE